VDNIECVFLYLMNDSCSIRLLISWVLVTWNYFTFET